MTTHAIDSDLMDRIINFLTEVEVNTEAHGEIGDPTRVALDIKRLKEELNRERNWVVISVLHPSRLVEMANDPLAALAWENVSLIADKVANNQAYDDELDLAIKEAWEEFLEEREKGNL